ncbi:MAG TPA: adenylate/guanylate cyclase domain-containing protein [Thermoanaerobaculia bacterium]|nr:adenylate/guanylate cyclase domain-containing protein [Thermoanaerobaculia bacterium]HUM29194.1 adenylate/guanylate cyclase domain-containing protein [Thermoanaerobaculia bacterium]HXK67573.1 adenylate/guanylate cyclase domain-containing protein [Thermoanaerobaculia bacterium]
MLTLHVSGPNLQRKVAVSRSPFNIGRSQFNDLVLPDFSVSRKHARIVQQGQDFMMEDLGSTNGIVVREQPMQSVKLEDAMELVLGGYTLKVELPREDFSTTYVKSIKEFEEEFKIDVSTKMKTAGETTGEKRREKMLDILVQMARTLLTARDLNEVMAKIMDSIFDILPCDRGFIMLQRNGELEPCFIKDRANELTSETLPISTTILNMVTKQHLSVITHDASTDERFEEGLSIRLHNIRSAMCAPLWSQDRVLGAVYVDSSIKAGMFTAKDLDVLTALANFAAVAIEQSLLQEKFAEEQRIKEKLARYHSPSIVNAVISGDKRTGSMAVPSSSVDISVLFADLVGFTRTVSEMDAEKLIPFLNEFFTLSTEVIFRHDGTLDKFIGDAVMAFFGAPVPNPNHADTACAAALDLMRTFDQWAGDCVKRGLPEVGLRIGISSGLAIVGDVGSEKRLDYTALGHTVNVASRLEETVAQTNEIVISDITVGKLTASFPLKEAGEVSVKGVSKPIKIYRLVW